jgi:predicted GTPase
MGKSGVIQTMGPKCEPAPKPAPPLSETAQRKIKDAEKLYQDVKQAAAPDDVTPELYLFSVLAEYKQYPQMADLVDAMLQKRPQDAALKDLKTWVRSQAAASP